jgi:hypothetical protein
MRKVTALLLSGSVLHRTAVSNTTPRFDGQWGVSITAMKSDCVGTYPYPMLIANGDRANGRPRAIVVSGRVG